MVSAKGGKKGKEALKPPYLENSSRFDCGCHAGMSGQLPSVRNPLEQNGLLNHELGFQLVFSSAVFSNNTVKNINALHFHDKPIPSTGKARVTRLFFLSFYLHSA